MDIVLLLLLILLNGVFAMSEMAVVSSRKSRLQNLADDGSPGAGSALLLHQEPSGFLSTIQVGITSVGILSGAIGEAAIADPLAAWLGSFTTIEPYARGVALTLTVVGLTYFSVVVGELVPKRLALLAPEGIATLIARPMMILARLAHPLVTVLSGSSAAILRLLGARRKEEPPVTDDEIKVLMEQGAEAGVFHESEQEIVSNVLRLDEQRISAIMTPRREMFVIDLEEDEEIVWQQLKETSYSRVVVCRDGLEHVLGVLQTGDLLKKALGGERVTVADLEALLRPPLYVPETVSTTQLLESFRRARLQFALLINEYGDVQGVVTLTDVLAAIVGELSVPEAPEDRDMLQREDGSWLVDGDVGIERMKSVLDILDDLPGEDENSFNTSGRLHHAHAGPGAGPHRPFRGRRLALRGHGHGPQPGGQGAALGAAVGTGRRLTPAPLPAVATAPGLGQPFRPAQGAAHLSAAAFEEHIETGRLRPHVAVAPLPHQLVAGLVVDRPARIGRPEDAQHRVLAHAGLDPCEVGHVHHVLHRCHLAGCVGTHHPGLEPHRSARIDELFATVRLTPAHGGFAHHAIGVLQRAA
jgi:putative hemolysin